MNVSCPQCSTVFRVDPAKVPEQGVRARCSVCSGLIAVHRPAVAAPVVPPSPPPAPVAPPPRIEAAPPAPVVDTSAPPVSPEPPPPPPVERSAPVAVVAPLVAAAPVPEPVAPPPAPRAPAPAARFNNPFLQQDPSTRARRLARALVSDLVVYYPEKRQRGLAEGNLKELFGEEIRKSWEEYSEQVGQEIASTTPYFTEALNEILAEGRAVFG